MRRVFCPHCRGDFIIEDLESSHEVNILPTYVHGWNERGEKDLEAIGRLGLKAGDLLYIGEAICALDKDNVETEDEFQNRINGLSWNGDE